MTHHFTLDRTNINRELHRIDGAFLATPPVGVDRWQGQDVTDRPQGRTRELLNTLVEYNMPSTYRALQSEIEPNLPWAEDHFRERISGEPLNPPPSNQWWPFAQQGHAEHVDADGRFSHTYPERFWPKYAGDDRETAKARAELRDEPMRGIYYEYGDLEDVVNQLKKDPSTRQAYLPVWFPEDTGAVEGQRVPCTLGYHFLIRDKRLQIAYFIRSCDYMRHFKDDVYMAVRLAAYMMERFNEDAPIEDIISLDRLYMHIVSFHIFDGDVPAIRFRHEQFNRDGGFNLSAML